MLLYAQGGSREVRGRKGAVQGSQMDPLDGPIAGLVHFFLKILLRWPNQLEGRPGGTKWLPETPRFASLGLGREAHRKVLGEVMTRLK